MARLTVAENEEHLAQVAAERFTQLVEAAVTERGAAFVSLTGGSTPRRLYSILADPAHPWRDRVPWRDVHLFWGDERHVPPDHPDSNYGMAKASLIDHISMPESHVHRMRGELPDARDAADDYERTLRDLVSTFDVMLLGLGEDAHIASIFPDSELLRDAATGQPFSRAERRVAAVWAPHLDAWRITLTPAAILDSRVIVMLVSGTSKAPAVHVALEAPDDVRRSPVQLLRAAVEPVEWFIDRAAATRIS